MGQPDVSQLAAELSHHVLTWIGFGTLVGLLAKAIMPGRDPGGAVATLMMGIGGTLIGCAVLMYVSNGNRISPISPIGFLVGTAGSFLILFFYRLLAGYFFVEGAHGYHRQPYFTRQSPRRRRSVPRRETILDE
ncbi:MAG: GlsB/YeaQ/YmgE family stress response membrane protein [Pirellulales bacterium]